MKYHGTKFVSDLMYRSNDIIVMQPAVTAGMHEFKDILRIHVNFSSQDYDRIVWEITTCLDEPPAFVHTGTLKTHAAHLHGGEMLPESYDYEYCGGFCNDAPTKEGKLAWYCENCKTNIRFRRINHTDVSSVLLHLLVKQMIPKLRTCNYVWTEETGVVGVLHDGLVYKPDSQSHLLSSLVASLGFIFMPGMHTLEGLGGFDEWLRYLVQIKFDQLHEMAESQLPSLIGPKHLGELNRGLRFWRE